MIGQAVTASKPHANRCNFGDDEKEGDSQVLVLMSTFAIDFEAPMRWLVGRFEVNTRNSSLSGLGVMCVGAPPNWLPASA